MTKREAYKCVKDAQKYLKYQDNTKFPTKAKKYLPIDTLKALATLEAALQVKYQLCPVDRVIAEMKMLKTKDKTSRGSLINKTIDSCIAILVDIMKTGEYKK